MKTILTAHLLIYIMLLPVFGRAQLVTISGKVTNSKSGNSLENVTVLESLSNIGTITNANGFFKLSLNKGFKEIKITDDGFAEYSKQITLKSDTTFTVNLIPITQDKNRRAKQNDLHADAKTPKKISGYSRKK